MDRTRFLMSNVRIWNHKVGENTLVIEYGEGETRRENYIVIECENIVNSH